MHVKDEIPRRIQKWKWTSLESDIARLCDAVESEGCDPLLTEAVNLLLAAQSKVADYFDKKEKNEIQNILAGNVCNENYLSDAVCS